MANALEEISREHLECAICCEPFQNPRLLPCLHSFCNDCLLNYLKGSVTSIVCPTCRQSYRVPNKDVTQFPINFPLRNLVDAICDKQKKLLVSEDSSTRENSSLRAFADGKLGQACDSCGQSLTIVATCTNCRQNLCQFCKEAHLRVLAFKGHEVVDVINKTNSKTTRTSHRELMQQKCSRHPEEEARYFCLGCRAMVCSDCAITEHRSSEHDVVSLQEATQKCREFLRKKVDGVLAIADEMDKKDKKEGHSTGQTLVSGKGDVIDNTRRARNACQIVAQALEQSSDDVSDFLVLFDTLDMMLQQICDEFTDAGYLLEGDHSGRDGATSTNNATSVPPLLAALQALSLTASNVNQAPFFRHHWRRHRPPHPPHAAHLWPRPHGPGLHRPPWCGGAGAEGPHHPHPWRHHHRGWGRGRGMGRGHCHPRRKWMDWLLPQMQHFKGPCKFSIFEETFEKRH